jgi:hypothetical protein
MILTSRRPAWQAFSELAGHQKQLLPESASAPVRETLNLSLISSGSGTCLHSINAKQLTFRAALSRAEGLRSLARHGCWTPIRKQATKLLLPALLLLATGLCGCSLIGPLINAAMPYAGLKLYFACVPEHTPVDTPSGPQPIEKLEAGDSVIGFAGRPVRILQKHSYLEKTETVFLHITFSDGAAVDLCGMHRVAGIRARELQVGQTVAGRKVTGFESRRGETRSYDLLTEDAGYQINGVPVNSMIEEMNAAAVSGKSPSRH